MAVKLTWEPNINPAKYSACHYAEVDGEGGFICILKNSDDFERIDADTFRAAKSKLDKSLANILTDTGPSEGLTEIVISKLAKSLDGILAGFGAKPLTRSDLLLWLVVVGVAVYFIGGGVVKRSPVGRAAIRAGRVAGALKGN